MNEKFLKIQPWKAANNVGYNVKPGVKEIVSADDTENNNLLAPQFYI
jgi:hypothetical protein